MYKKCICMYECNKRNAKITDFRKFELHFHFEDGALVQVSFHHNLDVVIPLPKVYHICKSMNPFWKYNSLKLSCKCQSRGGTAISVNCANTYQF